MLSTTIKDTLKYPYYFWMSLIWRKTEAEVVQSA
jgi:hypothetical protein